jgi:protocatechuate 3,4-dioxygenase alpha subunit
MKTIGPTPSQTIGPFFSFGMQSLCGWGEPPGDHPGRVVIRGRILDGHGTTVPDAVIEAWQAPDAFGRSLSTPDGEYAIATLKPPARAGGHAPHLEVSIFARGLLQRLVTRIYFPDEPAANAADPVLASVSADRRDTLVARPDPGGLRFDIHLQGPRETVFFAY